MYVDTQCYKKTLFAFLSLTQKVKTIFFELIRSKNVPHISLQH